MDKAIILKVGSNTDVHALKTSIVGNIRRSGLLYMDLIGMEASYIALKSIIMARGQLISCGYSLSAEPFYHEFEIQEPTTSDIKTGFRWVLKGVNNL